ncbi:hypothetical protein GIB67_030004 [Kingdonia uniflora]|uniref:Uncharacterized protein n=1 Tax=Kingdonia uniflora TaxID=39325 RepID=A0A7J7MY08_9MAGN|nr:hypothetical protein GIB67_030004 [Kingdonia uniflora]
MKRSLKLSWGLSSMRLTANVLQKVTQKNVSAWNMKRCMKVVREGFCTWNGLPRPEASPVNAFNERKFLASSLDNTKIAMNNLHHIVNVLVIILIAFLLWGFLHDPFDVGELESIMSDLRVLPFQFPVKVQIQELPVMTRSPESVTFTSA